MQRLLNRVMKWITIKNISFSYRVSPPLSILPIFKSKILAFINRLHRSRSTHLYAKIMQAYYQNKLNNFSYLNLNYVLPDPGSELNYTILGKQVLKGDPTIHCFGKWISFLSIHPETSTGRVFYLFLLLVHQIALIPETIISKGNTAITIKISFR